MGTNYYKVMPVESSIKKLMKQLIDENKFTVHTHGSITFDLTGDHIIDLVNKLNPNKIHIGKKTAGWKFLFNYNEWKYFDKSEKSIVDWIMDTSDGSYIEDEYHNIISSEDFIKMVNETYEPDPHTGKMPLDVDTHGGNEVTIHTESFPEIYIGKYRVATYTNFS